jgi:DNA-binding transcriptional LysR family regulator
VKIQQLRTFVTVAEHGSIRAAARALMVSQPAVTRTIRELEKNLEVSLVRRSVSGIELTETGKAFLVRAKLLLGEVRRTREELQFLKEGGHGHVSAAMTSTVGMTLFPAAMEVFLGLMPQAKVSITEDAGSPVLQKLQDGTLDFVVTNTLPGSLPSEFSQCPLAKMQLAVQARAGHPLVSARSLQELQGQLWVVPSINRTVITHLFTTLGLEVPPRIIECQSYAIAIHLLGRMDILGLFCTNLFEKPFASEGMQVLSLRETFPWVDVSVVTLRNSRLTPAAQCLIDCLRSQPMPAGMLPASTGA